MLHPPLFCIMQAVEQQKKSVTVSADIHRKIVSLRRGNQTYGDVIAELIKAHEEAERRAEIPCIDDISSEELDRRSLDAVEHPEMFISLEESMKRRAAVKRQ